MSLFSSLKKALGFPDEYEEDLEDLEDLEDPEDYDGGNTQQAVAFSGKETPSADTAEVVQPDLIAKLADEIVSKVNADVVSDNKKLSELRSFVAEKLYELQSRTYEIENARADETIAGLRKEIANLSSEKDTHSRNLQELENLKLSTTRQKRALGQRLTDMEQQIATLEAEKEQLEIENRTMVNRLRGNDIPTASIAAPGSEEIKRLKGENATVKREVNSLRRQLGEAEKRLDEYKSQGITAEAIQAIEDKLSAFEDVKAKKDSRIKSLSKQIADAEKENGQLTCRYNEALSKIADLESRVGELTATISTNLADSATVCEELRAENRRLTELLNASERVDTAQKQQNKKKAKVKAEANHKTSAIKISAIDELMESTDWFEPTPPGPRIKDPEVLENFGYKESPRKAKKNDKNQLTLF